MTTTEQAVLVIGCGVIGMTTAVCLAETGRSVHVLSDRSPQQTTSAVAGAVWGPYVSTDPRVLDWSLDSLEDLRAIANDRASGVRFVRGLEASRTAVGAPPWLGQLPTFQLVEPRVLPFGFRSGWSYEAPIFDMPVYLQYLEDRLAAAGVTMQMLTTPVNSITQLSGLAEVVVNCTGIGARFLVPDESMSTAWGQLIVVDNPGLTGFFSDYPESSDPTYYIAHEDHVVLGGCIDPVRTGLDPDSQVAAEIIQRCCQVQPTLADAVVREIRVGLRPVRRSVCLERHEVGDRIVVHNYGHGGSGVTLSWGCARQVQRLLTIG